MASGTKRRTSRRSKRKKPHRMRNVILVTVLFLGASLIAVLAVPAPGIAGDIRRFLYGKFGFISILLPLFLFQTGAWLLDFRFKRTGFRILSGIAVTGYFFTAVLDFVLSRRIDGFHNIPGGSIAGALGDVLLPITGVVITFLILFTAFVASLIAFTGWDIGSDFQLIADRFSNLINGIGRKRKNAKPARKEKPVVEEANIWSRDETDDAVPRIAFGSKDDARPDRNAEPSEPVQYENRKTAKKKVSPVTRTVGSRTYGTADTEDTDGYIHPPLSCLDFPDEKSRVRMTDETLDDLSDLLMEKLQDFGI
ncbi:MAG: hypothetical protein ABFR50_08855, partial [Candidatus Fermentibacteria bacterium]